MIEVQCEQGTPEWFKARLGIPTASEFSKLITPKTGKPSAQAEGYMHRLLAEWMIGEPLDDAVGAWLERGTELEQRAVSFYEFDREVEVRRVGFVKRDDGMAGCSPDGLIDPNGGLELKCPAAHTHVRYLLGEDVPPDYRAQVQGSIMICERDWWDFCSWNPAMPSVIVRVHRDEAYIKTLGNILDAFVETMLEAREVLRSRFDVVESVEVG